jgi:hypothetical protein
MVELSRDEVMEVLPESDWAYLADERGKVAERWLCFFTKQQHSAEGYSDVAAWDYLGAMSEEDKQSCGTSTTHHHQPLLSPARRSINV